MIGALIVIASAATGRRFRDGSEHPVVRDMLKEHVPHHKKWKYEASHIPAPVPHDVVAAGVHPFGLSKRDPHKPPKNTTFPKNLLYLLSSFSAGLGIPLSYNDVLPTDPPTSFWATQTYLGVGAIDPYGNPMPLDSAIALQERTLTKFGLNLYDGAVWEIALALYDLQEVAWVYERNVLYTSTTGPMGRDKGAPGGLVDIRADHDDYKYGDAKVSGTALKSLPYPGNVTHFEQMPDGSPSKTPVKEGPGAFYYRIIGPKYQLVDPFMGNYANSFKIPYPNNDTTTPWNVYGMIHFNDWKPITGENVWGGIIGPINTLYLATDGNLTNTTCGDPFYPIACDWKTYKTTPPAVQQAITMLPAFLALLSELGSIFHCPWGSKLYPWDPSEGTNVSNENNFSAYASLVMLGKVLKDYVGTSSSDPILQYAITSVDTLTKAMDTWFDTQLFKGDRLPDGSYAVPQGGHIIDGAYIPVPVGGFGGLAVDCQTWGMTVLGADRVDRVYGTRRAYDVWQAAKKWAGFWKKDHTVIAGVGYTVLRDVNGSIQPQGDIWSAEWTFGAINMAQKMAAEYKAMGDGEAYNSLMADAQSMWNEATKLWNPEDRDEGGLMFPDGSFVYANARFFIPWGWYANPISALCSTAWSVMQMQNFNPFQLGGGDKPALVPPPHLMNLLYSHEYME